jgi:hypothetical protein
MATAAVSTQHSAKREKLNQISSLSNDCNFKTEFTNWVEEPLSVTGSIKELPKNILSMYTGQINKLSQNILRQFVSTEKNFERSECVIL